MASSNEARIWAVLGSSGSGKGLWIKQQLRTLKPKRLLILDTKDEHADAADQVKSLRELALATFRPSFRVRYIPVGTTKQQRQAEFETVCRMVSAAKNCTFVVEELGRYTMPSWAPPAWADCCNDGRHDGLHLIASSQFPAQIDKAFLGNATVIHSGHLNEKSHRKVVGEKMDIDPELLKMPDLAYLHYDRKARSVTKGIVRIPTAKPLPVPALPLPVAVVAKTTVPKGQNGR
jgi:hypothetical protein